MSRTTNRSVCSLLLAACTTACSVWAVPALGASPDTQATERSIRPDRVLDHAANLIAEGKLMRAKAMLDALQAAPASATLSDDAGKRLWTLRSGVDRKIAGADRYEMSLQRAELALSQDDLVEAERQASAVVRSGEADTAQAQTAGAILQLAGQRRAEIAPKVPAALEQADQAFAQGDYAKAKELIERINRAGVALDDRQQRSLGTARARIVELELARGSSFQTASLGLLAPESGMGNEWLIGSAAIRSELGRSELIQPEQAQPEQAQPRGTGSYVGDQPIDTQPIDTQPIEVELVQPEGADGSTQPAPLDVIESARRFEAQTLMGEAARAYDERQLGVALDRYNRVLTDFRRFLSPEQIETATGRRSELQVQTRAQGGPQGALQEFVGDRGLARDQAVATYNNQLEQARTALAGGDPQRARNLAAQARQTMNQARDLMTESDYEARLNEVEDLLSNISQTEEQIRITERERRDRDLASQQSELEAQRVEERDQRILASIERVRALQLELKYEEALEVVESILFLDPNNPSGLLLKDMIEDTIIYRQYLLIQRDKDLAIAGQQIENQRAMIPPENIVDYPADWPAISFRRGEPLEFAESEQDRAVLATLRDTRLPIDLRDNAFEDVIAFVSSTARVDIDVDWESLADIGVDPDSPITLSLRSASLQTVLDRVVARVSDPTLPAGWAVQDGIITIASEEVLRRNTILEIYDIRDLLFVVPRFDNAPQFDLSSALQSGAGGGGGTSPFANSQDDDDEIPFEDRVAQIVNLIQTNVDPNGWVDLGGDTSSISQLGGNFVITTTPKNHRSIIGLLSKIRAVRALQINVEARFLTVSQDFFEQIGFDLDVYFNANSTEFQLANQIDPSLLPSDYFDLDGNLLDNVSGGGILLDTDGDGIPDSPITQPVLGPGNNGGGGFGSDQFSIIGGRQNSLGLTQSLAGASSFASTILGLNPALGITGRFLDDIQVDFLVEATQADSRSVILTAPRLTFTNGQRAYITVATSQTFVSDLTPVTSDGAVAFDPQIDVVSAGVVLDLDGVVSSDRRYVTLTVRTSLSQFEFAPDRVFSGGAGGGGGIGGGGEPGIASAAIQVPVVTATTINTTVTIPDQGTVLLGGQRLVEELQVETGVPVLSKIPILSRFFSNRIDVKSEQTLLILLKPTILIQNEEEERNFPGLADQLLGG
jgi:Flp pilus assembly secretin CpaC/tetratricopeptide (TPR) repeat protein